VWVDPKLADDVCDGRYFLPGAPTGGRETLITSPIEAMPQYLLQVPGPSWRSFFAAVFTAAFFLLLTLKLVWPAVACGMLALAMIVAWLWQTDPGINHPPADIGGGLTLRAYMTGSASHSRWAMIVVVLVAGSLFVALVFSYLYIWAVSPQVWPAMTGQALPDGQWAFASAGAFVVSAAAMVFSSRMLAKAREYGNWPTCLGIAVASLALVAALLIDFEGHWQTGLRPADSSYGALVYAVIAAEGQLIAAAVIMGFYTVARSVAGMITPERRATFDNTLLLWHYVVGQGLFSLLILHGFPRAAG
jgi:cytochrome c oxidase subunit I+III